MEAEVKKIKKWLESGSINIFGLPFAGKDTQANKLAKLLDGHVIGGGEILRSSRISDQARQAITSGKLIPIEDYLEIILPYLSQEKYLDHPLILSAVGRWQGEESGVIKAAEDAGHPIKAVIYLSLNSSIVYDRWHIAKKTGDRGDRNDDKSLALLEARLTEFQEKTLPVIEVYRNKALLLEIDGSSSPDQTTQIILKRLADLADQ